MENAALTIPALRRRLTDFFSESLIDEAQSLARDLLCDVMQLSPTQLLTSFDKSVNQMMADSIMKLANRIVQGEPLQYVTGKAQFLGREFLVNSAVLIPRPETEELVNWIVEENGDKKISLLDIGTGSGCIALSVKSLCNNSSVTAIDISEEALKVARENANRLNVDMELYKVDIFSELALKQKFDIVVSNPPYVRECEKTEMKSNVLDYEPHIALFVPDNNPLMYYRRIAQLSVDELLTDNGKLYFEINSAFGNEVCEMLSEMGFREIELRQDFTGRNRMVSARKG